MFKTVDDMANVTTYAGWAFDQPVGRKITGDYDSLEAAGLAIQAFARNLGLSARDIDFYIIKETISYEPLTKTRFAVTSTTTPIIK